MTSPEAMLASGTNPPIGVKESCQELIAPQEAFDYQRNLQYKVFHLQSHCIFVVLMGYGALAAMTYLYESLEEVAAA